MRSRILLIVLLLGFAASEVRTAHAASDWQPPHTVRKEIAQNARLVLQKTTDMKSAPERSATRNWDWIVLFTILDYLGFPVDSPETASPERVEASRIDKNTGGAGGTDRTTNLVDKAGLPRLLALAIEQGAAQSQFDGTKLTITSTPYAMFTMLIDDSEQNYRDMELFTRIGLTAGFAVDNIDSGGTGLSSNTLTDFTVLVRVRGDRSTRSKGFAARYDEAVRGIMQDYTNTLSKIFSTAADSGVIPEAAEDAIEVVWDEVRAYLESDAFIRSDDATAGIEEVITRSVRTHVHEALAKGDLKLPDSSHRVIRSTLFPMFAAQRAMLREALTNTDAITRDLQSKTLITLGYTQTRELDRPKLSELKLIVDQPVKGKKFYFNGFIALRHRPDRAAGEKDVADYGIALSWERAMKNTITRGLSKKDPLPVRIAVEARLSHLQAEHRERVVAQLKFDVPLPNGFTFPATARYDSRGLDGTRGDFQMSLGLHFDLDRLIALSAL